MFSSGYDLINHHQILAFLKSRFIFTKILQIPTHMLNENEKEMKRKILPTECTYHLVPAVSLTCFLSSLFTFLGLLGGTNSPSTSSLSGFHRLAPLFSATFSDLSDPFLGADERRDSFGSHERPITALLSDILIDSILIANQIKMKIKIGIRASSYEKKHSGNNNMKTPICSNHQNILKTKTKSTKVFFLKKKPKTLHVL